VEPAKTKSFAVKLRIPAWCPRATIEVNGHVERIRADADGYTSIQRSWKRGDQISLRLRLEARLVAGDHMNQGKVALFYGPLVLAADEALLAKPPRPEASEPPIGQTPSGCQSMRLPWQAPI